MLSKKQQIVKRLFDLVFSAIGIILCLFPILTLILIATISTKKFGLFSQKRVGQYAKIFTIYKIRTMRVHSDENFITTANDSRISFFGKFLRTYKLDEIPQLFNVLIGNMSFVGPRPDVIGYADKLVGEDRIVLSVKPGITGPATLKYKNEEELLEQQVNPKEYNDTVIWKEKVKINREYIKNWSFLGDLNYIFKTIFP
ncbi:MAG: sugar transferase [Flavobacteriaceae bacterium]|nr:sugar transferase [Flavobacteriaceae bacterium]